MAQGDMLGPRVSGYYTSSSTLNSTHEPSSSVPPYPFPPAVTDTFGACFHKLRKQSDLQLIRCVIFKPVFKLQISFEKLYENVKYFISKLLFSLTDACRITYRRKARTLWSHLCRASRSSSVTRKRRRNIGRMPIKRQKVSVAIHPRLPPRALTLTSTYWSLPSFTRLLRYHYSYYASLPYTFSSSSVSLLLFKFSL